MSEFICVNELPRILVVDASQDILEQVQTVFSKNAVVTCFASGLKALAWLAAHDVDIAIFGDHNSNTQGMTLVRVAHEIERHAALPVIALVSTLDAVTQTEGYKAGVMDFLLKPFDPIILRDRVNHVLSHEYLKNHLKDEVNRQTRRADEQSSFNKLLTKEMTVALAKTIDANDKYTSGHSERVALYARYIAKHAGEKPSSQEEVYFVGLLHDIGKIGVSRKIINKPSPLTKREFKKIQSHTIIGASILQTIDALPSLALGAHYHHERYDGQGYPQGLKGHEIPKLARIIAVADAYDAMTSNRSYRNALPQTVARAEIVKGKGVQFDPVYADIMIELIDMDKEYRLREGGKMP